MISLTCAIWMSQIHKNRVKQKLPGKGSGGNGRCWSKGTKVQLCRVFSRGLMYSMVAVVNNTVWCA